jgi:SAM-dependent methyltransferase
MREAYLRYSFTMGTIAEVDFIVDLLGLVPGQRILDVGCGPGRHSHELARRGLSVVGLDLSPEFIEIAQHGAPPTARFVVGDARSLDFVSEFEAVISLCQGAFGLNRTPSTAVSGPDPDEAVLEGMRRALRPTGGLVLSVFSAYFQVRYLEDADRFDAGFGLNEEQTTVRDETGEELDGPLYTTCFTPRELRLMVAGAGLEVVDIFSVTPGDYSAHPPDIDRPEYLVHAIRPN